jgi:hypothetical protein
VTWPLRPGRPNGEVQPISDDGLDAAQLAAPPRTDWNEPSATENLNPPDVQAEYSGGGFTGTDWNDPSATENLDPPNVLSE